MADKNKVNLMGRLTKEPEMRYTKTGKKILEFTVAVNRRKDKDGNQIADFFYCTAWEQSAKYLSSFAHKGSLVDIEGEIRFESYEKDGKVLQSTKILAKDVILLDSRERVREGGYEV